MVEGEGRSAYKQSYVASKNGSQKEREVMNLSFAAHWFQCTMTDSYFTASTGYRVPLLCFRLFLSPYLCYLFCPTRLHDEVGGSRQWAVLEWTQMQQQTQWGGRRAGRIRLCSGDGERDD